MLQPVEAVVLAGGRGDEAEIGVWLALLTAFPTAWRPATACRMASLLPVFNAVA